jgi:hypothetical protein
MCAVQKIHIALWWSEFLWRAFKNCKLAFLLALTTFGNLVKTKTARLSVSPDQEGLCNLHVHMYFVRTLLASE